MNLDHLTLDIQPLIAALAQYDATRRQRGALRDAAETEVDIQVWQDTEEELAIPVREAFYQYSKHVNSRKRCELITVDDVRNLVNSPPMGGRSGVPIELRISKAW